MEQLDKVYDTFVNLEKNFARSKKTRAEYLVEKFGGDINVGSFLIMHALTQTPVTTPEDIDKLSTVRKIFTKVKEKQNRLGSLTSLDFLSDNNIEHLTDVLSQAEAQGTGIVRMEQNALNRSSRDPIHYRARVDGVEVAPFNCCRYFNCDNPAMRVYCGSIVRGGTKEGAIVERTSLTEGKVVKKSEMWQ